MQEISALAAAITEPDFAVERLLDVAHALTSGRELLDGVLNAHELHLEPDLLRRFLVRLLEDRQIPVHKLRLEYGLLTGAVRFEMHESSTHSIFYNDLCTLVFDAVSPALALRDGQRLNMIYGAPVHVETTGFQRHPDASWCVVDNEMPVYPRVALEMALSNPSTLPGLVARCDRLLAIRPGSISAVIAIKLFHTSDTPKTAVLDNLHHCFVSV
ncbi:hypothetical protein Ct61P_15485 [Colletotrichum tofieldiae]|nr:hypothetical protein Ct61P_15485 [Colletotrichum tofieldiae]